MSKPKPSDTQPPALEATQRWLMAAITAPAGLLQGLKNAAQINGWGIDDVIAAPAGVSPHSRLDIYAQGYWLRLFACLKADYPALQRLMGEPLFKFFARAYLDHRPSRSFSLYGLGDDFPAFLRRSQGTAAKTENGDMLRFPLELARVEQAIAASIRAEGVEKESADIVDPFSLFLGDDVCIELPATTRLLLTRFPLAAFRPWLDNDTPDSAPETGVGFIAVKRQRFSVGCEALTDWQYHCLAAARRGPRPLRTCAEAAARRTRQPVSELLAQLAYWLPSAQTTGLVRMRGSLDSQ